MSARQNKKQRKGRNNANNRERTVTTLTEDPNTPYLVPTPSEEPAGANLMSSPFSVASSSAGNTNNGPYQMPSNYAFGGYNSFQGPIHGSVHHQQHPPHQQPFYPAQQQQQQPTLPPGQNDLEVLEKLKELIKNGQHEFYRAVPQPAALASIYLGPNTTTQSQVSHHPEQAPDYHLGTTQGETQLQANAGPRPSSPVDLGRRPPRIQSKEGWDPSGPKKVIGAATSQPTNNSNQASLGGRYSQNGSVASIAVNTAHLNSNGKSSLSGPLSTGVKSSIDTHMPDVKSSSVAVSSAGGPDTTIPIQHTARFDPATGGSLSSNELDQGRPPADRPVHGESSYSGPRRPGDLSPDKTSVYDGKDDVLRAPGDSSWPARDGMPLGEDRRRDTDRGLSSPTSRPPVNGNPDIRSSGPGDRGAPPPARDDRYYDRDNRDRDRDRDRWERDRRPYDRFRDNRMTDIRRPPPEQRHYEPDYDRVPLRRYDQKDDLPVENRRPADVRAPPTPTSPSDRNARQPPVDHRVSSSTSTRALPGDSRALADPRIVHPETRAPPPDPRAPPADTRPPARGPSFDDRHLKTTPIDDRPGARPPPATPARPAEPSVGRAGTDDRGGVRSSPVEDRSSRPIPLEERISRPSLQDRLSQPPVARSLTRQVSLEERLSHPPAIGGDNGARPPPQPDDRPSRPSGAPDRDRVTTRPGPSDERNTSRPAPPATPDERARLDDRPGRPAERYVRPPSPPLPEGALHRSATYPPPRSASVAREEPRAPPKAASPHRDYRRPLSRERVDVRPSTYRPDDRNYPDDRRPDAMDVDARYGDNRVPSRPFSPPSAADLARDRVRMQFPPSPTRAPVDAPPFDDRYPPGRDWQYSYSDSRRRDWNSADEEYWKSRPQWDRNNPPPDRERERFDNRDVPRWETRDERDRRESYPPPQRAPSPPRAYDGPPRPLSSRLTDNYPAPPSASDRSYPPPLPREPFSRVRPRSPSPRPRSVVDDGRPPIKRSRDEAYPSGYFSPQSRDPPLRRPTDYRGPSPPPTSSGSSYYDRAGPPPSSGGTTVSLGPGDRDYPPPRDRPDYHPPASYDRPRSPPRGASYPSSRGGFTRAVDARDDRRYLPPPPLPPPRRP